MNEITDNIWISDIEAVRERSTDRFDRVVTVCQDNVADNVGCAYDHFPLTDGDPEGYVPGDPSYEAFADAADTVYDAVCNDETVLVHCHAGRSRSVMVVTAVLARRRDLPYYDAVALVEDRNGIAQPSDLVREHAQQYISTHN